MSCKVSYIIVTDRHTYCYRQTDTHTHTHTHTLIQACFSIVHVQEWYRFKQLKSTVCSVFVLIVVLSNPNLSLLCYDYLS